MNTKAHSNHSNPSISPGDHYVSLEIRGTCCGYCGRCSGRAVTAGRGMDGGSGGPSMVVNVMCSPSRPAISRNSQWVRVIGAVRNDGRRPHCMDGEVRLGTATRATYLPEQGGPVLHGLSGAVDAIMRPARKYHLAGRVGLVGSPADQTRRVRTMRAAHISARPDDLMTAGPLRDVTVVSGAVPGRARVNEQRAGMPAVGGMLHG